MLSIGEEEHKGNELTKLSAPLLRELPLNYIGNVEGRDLYSGIADVVVCDGFIGNVALKVSEGLVAAIRQILKESLEKTVQRKIGYVLAKEAFRRLPQARRLLRSTAAAPLLGVKGVCLILPRALEHQRHQERHPSGRGAARGKVASASKTPCTKA
ncbi:MAG: hypothetical protein R2724_11375 [Bryobacterales bacterium]